MYINTNTQNEFDKMLQHVMDNENMFYPEERVWDRHKVEDDKLYIQTTHYHNPELIRRAKEIREKDQRFQKQGDAVLGNICIMGASPEFDAWILSHDKDLVNKPNLMPEDMPTVMRLYKEYAPWFLTVKSGWEQKKMYFDFKRRGAIEIGGNAQ